MAGRNAKKNSYKTTLLRGVAPSAQRLNKVDVSFWILERAQATRQTDTRSQHSRCSLLASLRFASLCSALLYFARLRLALLCSASLQSSALNVTLDPSLALSSHCTALRGPLWRPSTALESSPRVTVLVLSKNIGWGLQ